jgi:hypothetical protein
MLIDPGLDKFFLIRFKPSLLYIYNLFRMI